MRDYAEAVVETVRKPLVLLDRELRVKVANRAFYQTFGVTKEETENVVLFDLGNGQWDIPVLRTLLEEVLPRDSKFEDFEVNHEFPRIGRRVMLLNARRLLAADSRPGMILLAFEDATERLQAEARLALYAARLERSNRELQDFASVASHDLQEPLRKIRAFGDLLAADWGEALGDTGGDYLRRMQSAAARMQTLINDLLTFSRVETKARPFVEVDLGAVAREVITDLEVQIEQAGAAVEVGRLPTVEADPVQMRQLLQNLIGNALKYRRQGTTPSVKVYGEAQEDQGASCRILVEDNGIGFDEKYLDRIFTVFQRLHGRKEYEGTGIGLAVCRKIVERHGGSITARSAPQQGATFVVTLPVKQPKEAAI